MSASIDTPKFSSVEEQDKYFMNVAFEEAKKGVFLVKVYVESFLDL